MDIGFTKCRLNYMNSKIKKHLAMEANSIRNLKILAAWFAASIDK